MSGERCVCGRTKYAVTEYPGGVRRAHLGKAKLHPFTPVPEAGSTSLSSAGGKGAGASGESPDSVRKPVHCPPAPNPAEDPAPHERGSVCTRCGPILCEDPRHGPKVTYREAWIHAEELLKWAVENEARNLRQRDERIAVLEGLVREAVEAVSDYGGTKSDDWLARASAALRSETGGGG